MENQIYEHVITSSEGGQLRLVVSEFNGMEYLHIRKYYQNFDGEWCPTKTGVSIPTDIESVRELFRASAEIISLAESRQVIEEYFGDIIKDMYNEGLSK